MKVLNNKQVDNVLSNYTGSMNYKGFKDIFEQIGYNPTTQNYIFRNHSESLGQHLFVPLRYSKGRTPKALREIEKRFDDGLTVPRTLYRCTNCGPYGVETIHGITTIEEVVHKYSSPAALVSYLHRLMSKLYCTKIQKPMAKIGYRLIKIDHIKDAWFDIDRTYEETYRFFMENKLILLNNKTNKLAGQVPFTLREFFNYEKPFKLYDGIGRPLDYSIVSNPYTASKIFSIMHPNIVNKKTFAGQQNRRKRFIWLKK